MDGFFFIAGTSKLLQGPSHKEVSRLHTQAIKASWYKKDGSPKRGARINTFTLAAQHASPKLSNISSTPRNFVHHRAAQTVFLLRTHAYRTIDKAHVVGKIAKSTDPRKLYYTHMYPDTLCPYGCGERESTLHMLTCKSNPDLERLSMDMWNKIYRLIEGQQERPNSSVSRALYPFAITPPRTPATLQFWDNYAAANAATKADPRVKQLTAFPATLAATAYIPNGLQAALAAMGAKDDPDDPPPLAERIALLIHDTAHEIMRQRRRHIDQARHQRELYLHFVKGKPQDFVVQLLRHRQEEADAAQRAAHVAGQNAAHAAAAQANAPADTSPRPAAQDASQTRILDAADVESARVGDADVNEVLSDDDSLDLEPMEGIDVE
jgi:hypothetical protein